MNRKGPVTIGLILVNLAVFAYLAWREQTLWFSEVDDFLALLWQGANFNPFTLAGEPWRLLTSMFMHGNVIHLLVNLYGLYQIGQLLERDIGPSRMILVYMIAGVAGGIASLLFNLFVVSVGASGAIFGLYGYYIIRQVLTHYQNRDMLISILANFMIFAGVNYFIALKVNVDTAGHIGGFIAGAGIAVLQQLNWKLSPFLLGGLLLMVTFSIVLLPRHQVKYYNLFQAVIDNENYQENIYRQKLTDAQFVDSLRVAAAQWDTLRMQLHNFSSVPQGLEHDTAVLARYMSLRREETAFRLKAIHQESYIYLDSVEVTYQKLDSLPKLEHMLNYRKAAANVDPTGDSIAEPATKAVRVFYDSNWVETTAMNGVYYRIGQRDSAGRWQGDVRDYYGDGSIQMKGKYLNDMHHGVFLYYTQAGRYVSAGRYEKEVPIGKWEYFHDNGKLHREVIYASGAFTKNVYDTAGNLQVENGNGHAVMWYPDGGIAEEGDYKNGLKQGIWKGYHRNGSTYFEELYNENRLVRGLAMDENGNRFIYDHSSFYPHPEIGMDAYRNYLKNNRRRPDLLNGYQGTVKLTFTVDENSTLLDFVVMESICGPCDKEAIRLVKEGPAWRAARIHGHKKIRSQGYVEVPIE